jgi:metal transporter CNNM
LIGEEIYDEFDPEGAQALYNPSPAVAASQTSPDAQQSTILKRKGSAPQLTDSSAPLAETTVPSPGSNTPNKSSLLPGPLLRPLNVKGLDFIRSRSAPPTQRGKKPPVPYSLDMATPPSSAAHNSPRVVGLGLTDLPTADEFDDDDDEKKQSEVIVDDGTLTPVYPYVAQDEQLPAPEPTNAAAAATTGSATPTGTRFKPTATIISPTFSTESATPSFRTAPQAMATPTNSLEAIIRKRRAAAAAASSAATVMTGNPLLGASLLTAMSSTGIPQGAGGPSARPSGGSSVAKGTRFKSSPIGGGQPDGVIVAERVKKGLKGSHSQQRDDMDVDADDHTDAPEVPRSD